MKRWLIPLLLAATAAHGEGAPAGADPFAAALAQARERRVPVLVDFTAPWCYSCYYMARNVLTGAEWQRAKRDTVVIELDADSPEGARWMAEWRVKAMPTYLVFNADGAELGRVLGEQTRADFYAWLSATIGRDPLEVVKAKVTGSSRASVAAAREVLRAYHARYDAVGGQAWLMSLAPGTRAALASNAQVSLWIARLELQRAAAANDVPGCVRAAPAVLAASLWCERPYELGRLMACTEQLPAKERQALLRPHAESMRLLFDRRVLSSERCADERSIVLVGADLSQALGDKPAERRVLDRAITDLKRRIDGDLGKDRSMADNLRVYLDRAGRVYELDRMLPLLIEAYPDDYVYQYRYARSLATRGKHADAVPMYELAAARTYGVNKLRIAELRAQSLQTLGRNAEARTVLREALQANGPWFPEDAAKLKALLDSLPP